VSTPATLSTAEATRELGFASSNYLLRLIASGMVRAEKVGGKWRVDAGSVAAYKTRTAHKRSAKANAAGELARRRSEAAQRFRRTAVAQ